MNLPPLAQLTFEAYDRWPLLAVVAVVAATVAWRYASAGRSAVVPLVLRGLALVAVGLAMLGPTLTRPAEIQPPRVLLLIDRSLSMDVVDDWSEGASVRRLAALLDPNAVDLGLLERLRQLTADIRDAHQALIRARASLELLRLTARHTQAADAQIDAARRQLQQLASQLHHFESLDPPLRAVLARLDRPDPPDADWLTLLNAVEQFSDRAAVERLADDPAIEQGVRRFQSASRLTLARAVADQIRRRLDHAVVFQQAEFAAGLIEGDDPLDPARGATDPATALREWTASAFEPEAVVMITDGRVVAAPAPASFNLPVYAIDITPGTPVRDVAITRLELPRLALPGETVLATVELRAVGFGRVEVDLRLRIDDQTLTRRVRLEEARPTRLDLPLSVTPGTPLRELVATVTPLPREVTKLNNTRTRTLAVRPEPLRVQMLLTPRGADDLLLESTLRQTPWVQVELVEDPGELVGSSPPADVLILKTIPAYELSQTQWDAVVRLLDAGGRVIVLPGELPNWTQWPAHPVASRLLPWQAGSAVWQVWPGAQPGFSLAPPDNPTAATPRLSDSPFAERELWLSLPSLSRILALPPLRDDAQPLLVERGSNRPVLVSHPVGRGTVLTLATNELWRWRTERAALFDRFWTELIRPSPLDRFITRLGDWRLDLDPLDPSTSDALRITLSGPTRSPPTLRIRDALGRWTEPAFTPERPGRLQATISPPPPGPLELFDSRDPADPPRLRLIVRPDFDAELFDLSPDPAWLNQVTRASSGTSASLEQLDQIIDSLRQLPRPTPQPVRFAVWSGWAWFAIIAGALTLEWAWRTLRGLS